MGFSVEVICDCCGYKLLGITQGTYPSINDVFRLLTNERWTVDGFGLYCPSCMRKLNLKERETK